MGPYSLHNSIVRAAEAMQAELMQLRRENDILINGAANQAKTIRTLNERNSQLEAEVIKGAYEIELIKGQGRKTRHKVRNLKKAAADAQNYLGQLLNRAEQAEARYGDALQIAEKTKADNHQLCMSIERIQDGRELPFTISIDRFPFKVTRYADIPKPRYFHPSEPVSFEPVKHYEMMRVAVVQSAIQLQIAPEHHRDVEFHHAVARQAAAELTRSVEQQILDAIRGEATPVEGLAEKHYRPMMQMRQQRQLYSDLPYSLSAEEAQHKPLPRS